MDGFLLALHFFLFLLDSRFFFARIASEEPLRTIPKRKKHNLAIVLFGA